MNNDFYDHPDFIKNVALKKCIRCGSATVNYIAYAESILYPAYRIHYLKCANTNCNCAYWIYINKTRVEIKVGYTSKTVSRINNHSFSDKILDMPKQKILHISKELLAEIKEAMVCLEQGHYLASATLARRALETSLLNLGAIKLPKIYDMILYLIQKGVVTSEIADFCVDVKSIGNRGAHSGGQVSKNDAESALEYMDIVLSWIFGNVIPVTQRIVDN